MIFIAKTLRILLLLLLILGGIVMALWGWLQTGTGQRQLAAWIEKTLSTPSTQISLQGLSGQLPQDIQLDSIKVHNAKGETELVVHNARLAWSPLALFTKKISITHLTAEHIAVTPHPSEKQAAHPTSTPVNPALLGLLSHLAVQDFEIKKLTLAMPGTEKHFTYTLYGGMKPRAETQGSRASLHMETLAGPNSHLVLTADFIPKTSQLALHGYFNEEAGGIVGTMLSLPSSETIFFRLDGEAPLTNWQGTFNLSLSSSTVLAGTVALPRKKEGFTPQLDATLTPVVRFVPAALAPYLPEDAPFHLVLNSQINETGTIAINTLSLSSKQHQLRFSGTIDKDETKGTLTGRLSVPAPFGEHVAFTLPITKNASTLTLHGAKATLLSGHATGNATFLLDKHTLDSTIRYETESRESNQFTLTTHLSGTWEDPRLEAKLEGQHLKHDILTLPSLTATLEAHHLASTPEGEITLTAQNNEQTYRLHSPFSLAKDRLDFPKLLFTTPDTSIQGKLHFYTATQLLEGTLQGNSNLALLSPYLSEKAAGNFNFTLALSPQDAQQNATIRLNGQQLRYGTAALQKLSANGEVTDILRAAQARATIQLDGLHSGNIQEGNITLEAHGSKERVDFSTRLTALINRPLTLMAQGHIEPGDTLTTTVETMSGQYSRKDFALLTPLILKHSSTSTSIAPTRLRYTTGTLSAAGEISPNRADITAELQGLPLSALPFNIQKLNGTLNGTMDGKLFVTGKPASPTLSLSIELAQLAYQGKTPAPTLPPLSFKANATLAGKKLNAEGTLHSATGKQAELSFSLPADFSLAPFSFSLPENGQLQGHITSEVNIAALNSVLMLDNQTLAGTLSTNITVSGTALHPEFTGTSTLTNGEYQHNIAGILLHNIDASLRLSKNRIEITHANATDGGKGTMQASGGIDIGEHSTANVKSTLKNFYLMRSDDLKVNLSGDTTLSGPVDSLGVQGTFTVNKAEIHIPDRIAPAITKLNVTEINQPLTEQQKMAMLARKLRAKAAPSSIPIALDITINLPNQVFLRGRGLDAELGGKLHITGNASEPEAIGTLSVIRGRYQFIGQNFTLAPTSTATFRGPIPPSPFLDITAETPAEDIIAQVNFSGTLNTPKLTVTSTPALPMEEVLSRMLFGRNLKNITPAQALRLVSVTRELLGKGGGDINFLDRTRSFLRLDDLDIKQGEEGESAFGIGKYIKDGIYVGAQKNLGTEGGKATIEIEVTPHITVESEVGTNAPSNTAPGSESTTQGGVGVNWKYDY